MSEIRLAVKQVYDEMPAVFDGIELIRRVREKIDRKDVYDGTITRTLRQLRKFGVINYRCVGEKRLSQYEKVEV